SNGFTGALFVNGSTGAVTVTNAGPVGDFPISVSSTNACASLTTTPFSLKVIGSAAFFTATAGTPQSALVNTAFPITLQAKVTDSAGHPLSNVGVNFTVPASAASATIPGTGLVQTNSSGVASITATANGTTGRYTVKATVGGLPDALFDLSNISPGTPTNVVATAMTPTSVLVTWTGLAGATYEVMRLAANSVSSTVGSSTSGALTDINAIADTAYLYAVREINPAISTYGTADLATTVIFTDSPLASGIVKTSHFTQLRTAVEAVRALAGLLPGSYTDTTLTSGTTTVKRVHLTGLRAALDEARAALLLPAAAYARSSIVAGTTTFSAVDVIDLRTGVQ
ncbi:MAG: Ig-like domain-containing protein, partial [Thermoanaerobaculia bacterium]